MYNIITTKHRLGEKRTANNGLVMTIVEYNSSMNISVQFETGEIVRNKTYSNFPSSLTLKNWKSETNWLSA